MLREQTRSVLIALVLVCSSWHTMAMDINQGEILHNEHCTRCHQPDIYERDKRIVKNLQHLRTQVQFCEVSNDLTWFDEEVDAVTEHLNLNYYLFGLK